MIENPPISFRKRKENARKSLAKKYFPGKDVSMLLLIDISDAEMRTTLTQMCQGIELPCLMYSDDMMSSVFPSFREKDFLGIDAVVTDMNGTLPLIDAVRAGNVPIIPLKNTYSKTFTQYNPMRFEGNAFLYRETNPYMIFEQIVRFLENTRFPEDYKTLTENVRKTF